MKTGAVIVAAGMSTRMKQFKPLMRIGTRTMAEQVIETFRQAGIREIVLVTGYQAHLLESSLRDTGVTFLDNHQYASTQMFDSAKIGLEYLKDRCDRVFFCPGDIPSFLPSTVSALERQEGDVILPVCQGTSGHPVLIRAALIPEILNYQGTHGLKGALHTLPNLTRVRVEVADTAITMDADTKEDFQRLLDLERKRKEVMKC